MMQFDMEERATTVKRRFLVAATFPSAAASTI
jgi:hypothetical protein